MTELTAKQMDATFGAAASTSAPPQPRPPAPWEAAMDPTARAPHRPERSVMNAPSTRLMLLPGWPAMTLIVRGAVAGVIAGSFVVPIAFESKFNAIQP